MPEIGRIRFQTRRMALLAVGTLGCLAAAFWDVGVGALNAGEDRTPLPPGIVSRPPPKPRTPRSPRNAEPDERQGREIDEATAKKLVDNIPDYVVLCPICQGQVRQVRLLKPGPAPDSKKIPDDNWRLSSDDVDIDLCPYPTGQIRFHAEITQCPHCGFAARQSDFLKPQTPETIAWVRESITPNFRAGMLRLVGEALPPEGEAINPEVIRRMSEVFTRQSDLPDIPRLEAARAYYAHIGADEGTRSRMTQLAAWAYRRAQNAPPEGAFMLEGLRPILRALDAQKLVDDEAQTLLERVYALLDDTLGDGRPRYTWHQRQCAQFLIAGYYDRLGYLSWAKHCLDGVEAEARKVDGERPELDPMWNDLDAELDHNARLRQLIDRRLALANVARVRKQQLDIEANHLAAAADLLRRALENERTVSEGWAEVPARVFLIGEWFRRAEHFSRAALWLDTARRMREHYRTTDRGPLDREGLEIMSAVQLERLREYCAGLPERPDLRSAPVAERVSAEDLLARYIHARKAAMAAAGAAEGGG